MAYCPQSDKTGNLLKLKGDRCESPMLIKNLRREEKHMKKQYENPNVELLAVDEADILTMSREDDMENEDALDGES